MAHKRCIEDLRRAERILYAGGYHDESDAVEQAIVLLEARPTLTDDVLKEVAERIGGKIV